MQKNGGVNPRQPVDQDLSVSPNINALRATDSYLYKYYMLFSLKYQLIFILFLFYKGNFIQRFTTIFGKRLSVHRNAKRRIRAKSRQFLNIRPVAVRQITIALRSSTAFRPFCSPGGSMQIAVIPASISLIKIRWMTFS